MKVTILVENSVDVSFLLTAEHGLSMLIDNGNEKVLFDTGQGMGILNNPQILGIDLTEIKCIALSHGHSDHTRGLKPVLEVAGKKDVYAHPEVFGKKYFIGKRKGIDVELSIGIPYEKKEIEEMANLNLSKSSVKLAEGIWTSGEIPFVTDFEEVDRTFFVKEDEKFLPDTIPDDLALFVKSEKGYSIILGCGHRGVGNTIEHISKITGEKEFYALIGGTHLVSADEKKIKKTMEFLKKYRFKKIVPLHCTGIKATFEIFKNLGEVFVPGCVGTVIEI
jgi:7,8-dihydropterin-6-yl-methyl-4-(beta-D-ribofuranosyl)aminobenzene 5'-phosphate synthase